MVCRFSAYDFSTIQPSPKRLQRGVKMKLNVNMKEILYLLITVYRWQFTINRDFVSIYS